MTTYTPLTAEERAEARRIADNTAARDQSMLGARLVAALNALEAAERERDEARADTRELLRRYDEEVKISVGKNAEINTARAQVATLAEALRTHANPAIADEILKEAGVET